jgi:hypothetical protein
MDFRNNFQTTFGNRSYSYGQYASAYRYGYTVANDQLYSGREWDVVEADVRSDWERGHRGTWDELKDAVHYGWDRSSPNSVKRYTATKR